MTLQHPPSTRHDVLAISPQSHFAVLPDLPYLNSRPRSSTNSSGQQQYALSAPTSPLGRPQAGYSSLGLITPLDLPGPSNPSRQGQANGGIRSVSAAGSMPPPTPQQGPRQQQAIPSFFPMVGRVNPPPRQAPLSSTNLASFDKSTRARSKSRSRVVAVMSDSGSGSETEKGGSDSDVTVLDHRRAGKASYSQTDLPALKTRMVSRTEAVNSVTSTTSPVNIPANAKIRDTESITVPRHGRRLSPKSDHRPLPIHSNTAPSASTPISPGKSPKSRSSTSLSSMRKSPTQSPRHPSLPLGRSPTTSPRHSAHNLGPLTPMTSSTNMILSPVNRVITGMGKSGGSDADVENDSLTDDSSVQFNTKRRNGPILRHRRAGSTSSAPANVPVNGLGLSLGSENSNSDQTKVDELIPEALERMYRSSSLLYLRILAIVPACWGTLVLGHGVIAGGVWHDVWPWGADFSAEAMYRRSHGTHLEVGVWKSAVRGDLLLAIAWAILTGHFCFRFTTGLTYRWRSYYDLLPVLVRLLALQALCWPATYITLSYLGPSQPLFAWAVIGVSTGITYAIIMWLASNVLPDPDDDRSNSSRSSSRSPRGSPSKNRYRYKPKAPVFPVWGEAPLIAPPEPPPHLTWWERLNYKRRWDWGAVAREVGWKVGALLLLTQAWVFWQIHIGWLVRSDEL